MKNLLSTFLSPSPLPWQQRSPLGGRYGSVRMLRSGIEALSRLS